MNVRIRKRDQLYKIHVIFFIGILLFSYQLRGIFFQGTIQHINLLSIISIILLIFNKYENINIKIIMIIMLTAIVGLYSQVLNGKSFIQIMFFLTCIIMPLILITFNINERKIEEIFLLFLKFFNFIVVLLFIFAVIDKITGNIIIKNFVSFLKDAGTYKYALTDSDLRYYSFMGHPLYNAQLFLMYYILNVLANKYFDKKINKIAIIIISLAGVAFTASKTGIVLIAFSMLYFNLFKKNRNLYYVLIIIVAIIFCKIGFFDSLIYRFINETLTSGRNEMWEILNQNNIFPIKFWTGYGSGFNSIYNDYVSGASMAFEYPVRLFQLEYGSFFTILLYTVILIYPIIVFLKRKQFSLLLAFIIIFVDVNTYNGIGLGMDMMLVLCVYIYIILNISKYIEDKNL